MIMKNTFEENRLKNYQYDINIIDEILVTLDISKIENNANYYRQFTVDAIEVDYSKYCIAVYEFDTNTVLTFLENGTKINSQFLIKDRNVFEYLKKEDLSKYVDNQIIDLLFSYFD